MPSIAIRSLARLGPSFFLWVFIVGITGIAAAEQIEFKGCYARWSADELVLGNAKFERRWSIKDGLLTATSFRNARPLARNGSVDQRPSRHR